MNEDTVEFWRGLSEIVANQVMDGDPPQARQAAFRLKRMGYPDVEALAMMAGVYHEAEDVDSYVRALDALPERWVP